MRKNGGGDYLCASLPPAATREQFIHRLRPFVLENEATYFHKVSNVLGRYLALAAYRTTLRQLKEVFNGEIISRTFQLRVNDTLLNSDDTVRLWLNAFEYHRDEDKRRAIEALHAVLPEAACEWAFFSLLQHKAVAVMDLGFIIDGIIRAPTNQR